jgi:hypothetical protein
MQFPGAVWRADRLQLPEEEGLLMSLPMSEYETNRAKIPLDELMKHDRQWVAFRRDGSRILASAPTIAELEARLVAAGQDPQNAAYERIEFEDSYLGGAELL